jgi:beta-mannosidase
VNATMERTVNLNGMWRMRKMRDEAWVNAVVPGSVISDYVREGLIEDPYFRDRQYEIFDLFREDYVYEREFELDGSLLYADRLELCCEGLDTLAEISVNGILVATTKNMHRTYRWDLQPYVVAGVNHLQIIFRSSVAFVEQKQQEMYLWAANDDYVVQGYPHLRKAHHMFGWDWGPKIPDYGIWRNIYITAAHDARIDDVYVTQHHDVQGEVTLDIRLTTERYGAALSAEHRPILDVVLTAPEGPIAATAKVQVGHDTEHVHLTLRNSQLWWPNGLGAQPLYTLTIQLLSVDEAVLDTHVMKLGLRTLTVRQEPDEWGESFEIAVNGVSIFTMGANYIPQDNIRSLQTRERAEQLIRDCVHANFNCIRVWGGAFYPDDYFYDLCDQYGLIVWQDHLFSCAEYLMTDEFTAEIKAEVADNVRRLRHHASLGIWCGNNEMEWGWVEWDFPKRPKLRSDYLKQFEIILPEVTKEHDPNTFYWVASPSSGGGFDRPNAPDRGDVHYWEVWHGGKPFTEYRKHYFRFCSEFGFQSFPSMKTVASFTLPGDRNIFTNIMESHQKNAGGNGKILYGISENFLYPKDFDSLLYVSQLLQAEAMRYGVEHWRRHRGRCMGSVYWQLNDCWPVASWSSIDYYGRWKALHYAAKRFYAPLIISAEESGMMVNLAVTNDTLSAVSGTVRWRLRTTQARVLLEGSIAVEMPALTAGWCAELDFCEEVTAHGKENVYLEYEWIVHEQIVSSGYVLCVKPKHLRLAEQPNLRADIVEAGDQFTITVHADALALFVELDFNAFDARFSDNFFHVSAGVPKQVILAKQDLSTAATLDLLRQNLKIRSLTDTFDR